jgi:TPP-dependent indolepyruvate ferredoxin oxidoreductase alpha subunit
MALFDPRPDLGNMVRRVGQAFALSEASNMPAMMQLRIRACHVRGSFVAADNVAPRLGTRAEVAKALGPAPLPARPPAFCVGCPERPVFSALKLAQRRRPAAQGS